MNQTIHATTIRPPSEKQLNMIKALSWQLRPYYDYHQWGEIRSKMLALIRHTTMQKCRVLIQRMLSALDEKQKQNARAIWIPMDYGLDSPTWQRNLALMADFLFPENSSELAPNDESGWRSLKNRIEQEELRRSYQYVVDDFEDSRPAEDEEQRWRKGKPSYQSLIEGVDFLEPVAGIDY